MKLMSAAVFYIGAIVLLCHLTSLHKKSIKIFMLIPHRPCKERPSSACASAVSFTFQSTLLVWGATILSLRRLNFLQYFNPHSPCGERLYGMRQIGAGILFQSTLPVWGATTIPRKILQFRKISIHTPRVGSDSKLLQYILLQ